MMPKGFLCLVIAALLCALTACSEDNVTTPTPAITFRVSGNRTVAAWTTTSVTVTATAGNGERPELSASGIPEEMTVGQTAPDTIVLAFQPTSWQVGKHSIWIFGHTSSARDSIALEFSVLREPPATSLLYPLDLGNRWIYQSVHNRGDFDTVTLTGWDTDHGRGYWEGTFYPTLPVLSGGIVVTDSTVSTRDRGLQFRFPRVLRDSFFVESRGLCYALDVPRIVQKLNGTMTVPAGTFANVLMFTTLYDIDCGTGEREVIAEEIYVAIGVGIIKATQIRSSHCQSGCSSRWELYSYRVSQIADTPLRP